MKQKYRYAISKGVKSGRYFIRGPIKDKRNLRKNEHGIVEFTRREALKFKKYVQADNHYQYKFRLLYDIRT